MSSKTTSDLQLDIYHLKILTDLVWDLATEFTFNDVPTRETLERLMTVSRLTADKVIKVERDFDKFARGGKWTPIARPETQP